ncbi:MAG: ISL3 family transposase [Dictyoglomi bacterium]|nr:ISL3 family transposase [Dictyoglomota bacterium]
MKIKQILEYFKENLDILDEENEAPTQDNVIKVTLRRKEVICKDCGVKMQSHGLGRERNVLLGEGYRITYHPLRYICPKCRKTYTLNPPFVGFKARIAESCKEEIIKSLRCRVSINEVAKKYGISHTTVTRILRSYKNRIDWENLGDELKLGIDEHSFRGYDMVISVRELTTHTQLGFIYPDRKETLKEFLMNLPVKDKIKEVTVDMKSSYINSVKEELPKAKIVLDHFHVIQDANREISKAIEIEASVSRSKIPRRVFFKDAEKLKDKEKEKLRKILREHPYLSPYYVIKELIRKAYKAKDKGRAREILELAIAYGRKTGDTDIERWTDRLVKYEEYILNYFDSRATNAQLEGSNLVVKLIKRISFGFRNPQNYIQRLSIAFSNV